MHQNQYHSLSISSANAIDEGLNERKMEKEKEPGQKDKKIIRKELETKAIPSAIIEAIVEEEEEVEVDEDIVTAEIEDEDLTAVDADDEVAETEEEEE